MTFRFNSESKVDVERKMYGTTTAKMRDAYKGQMDLVGRDMFVASILSDAQECIEHDDPEFARQLINQAKWLLFKMDLEY
jgi:hypothetical protein